MAFTEVKRERARKKITLPSGDTIYIPVIISLTVRDQNGQETEHHYLNTTDALNREVHVDHLTASIVDADGNPTSDPGMPAGTETIDVERIDTWIGLDAIEQAQESKFLLDNTTGNDTHPPQFTTHQKTHIYRYYKNPTSPDDNGVWVDSELIDEISVVDQNGQEWQYFLDNPFNDDTRGGDNSGQASTDDPDISDTPDLDPPYRTDPFQNIVNFSGESVIMVCWRYGWVTHANPSTGGPPCGTSGTATVTLPPGATLVCGSIASSTLQNIGDPLPAAGGFTSEILSIAEKGPSLIGGPINNPNLTLPTPSISPTTVTYPAFAFFNSPNWDPTTDATFGGPGKTVSGSANLHTTMESGGPAFIGATVGGPGAWSTGYFFVPQFHDDTGSTITGSLNAGSATYTAPGKAPVNYESFATYLQFPHGTGSINSEFTTAGFYFTAWLKRAGAPDPDMPTFPVSF